MQNTYIKTLFVFLILVAVQTSYAQGIQFFEGTWAEALSEAKRQDKLIFIDAYATWCGPCKRMAKEVFPQQEVGQFFNRYFINLKLDMERGEGLIFREQYPVAAFPTLYFINGNGEVVHRVVGAQSADALLRLGQFALRKTDDSEDYAKRFEEGDRDPDMVLKYVTALNKAGKPSLKIVNTYLKSQKDLSTPQNLQIIFEGVTEADTRVFDLMIEHRATMDKLIGKQRIDERIELACNATLMKAVEFGVEHLHKMACDYMKAYRPDKAEEFILDANLQYYKATANLLMYLKACNQFAEAKVKTNPIGTAQLGLQLAQENKQDKAAIQTAIDMGEKASKHATTYEPHFSLAQIYMIADKKKDAIKSAEKAKKLLVDDQRMIQYIDSFIQHL